MMTQNIELNYDQLTSIFINSFNTIARWELIKLNKLEENTKNLYLAGALSKNISLLNSASLLLNNDYERESRILIRSLIERVVYNVYLEDNNLYDDFADWSFIRDYHFKQKRSADENLTKAQKKGFEISDEYTKRINYLKKKHSENSIKKLLKKYDGNFPIKDIETHLKDLDLNVLYKYGYDFYSKEVHVMHSDGKEECINFIKGFSEEQSEMLMENKKIMLTNLLLVSSYNLINILGYSKIETEGLNLLSEFSNAVADNNEILSFEKAYHEYKISIKDNLSELNLV